MGSSNRKVSTSWDSFSVLFVWFFSLIYHARPFVIFLVSVLLLFTLCPHEDVLYFWFFLLFQRHCSSLSRHYFFLLPLIGTIYLSLTPNWSTYLLILSINVFDVIYSMSKLLCWYGIAYNCIFLCISLIYFVLALFPADRLKRIIISTSSPAPAPFPSPSTSTSTSTSTLYFYFLLYFYFYLILLPLPLLLLLHLLLPKFLYSTVLILISCVLCSGSWLLLWSLKLSRRRQRSLLIGSPNGPLTWYACCVVSCCLILSYLLISCTPLLTFTWILFSPLLFFLLQVLSSDNGDFYRAIAGGRSASGQIEFVKRYGSSAPVNVLSPSIDKVRTGTPLLSSLIMSQHLPSSLLHIMSRRFLPSIHLFIDSWRTVISNYCYILSLF